MTTNPTDEMREAFEAWAVGNGHPVARTSADPDRYAWGLTRAAWAGWQAATKAANRPAVDEARVKKLIRASCYSSAHGENAITWEQEADSLYHAIRPYLAPSGEVVEKCSSALNFFKSVIQSGEQWTSVCQSTFDDAKATLNHGEK